MMEGQQEQLRVGPFVGAWSAGGQKPERVGEFLGERDESNEKQEEASAAGPMGW